MLELNEGNFDNEVLKSDKPVVIDFWAEWCGPCRISTPIIEDLSKDYANKAKFGKVDVDANQKLAQQYGIMSIPSFLIFEKGQVKATSIGARPKEEMKRWLDKNL